MDGVLRSWAVPKGPSYDMNDKRLAVKVEDHPLEYGDFEGVIPSGNYGAGGVIVWDRGEWIALEDWREGLEKGKLLFELRGYKLHGKWTLVKIKKSEKDWLLIKERDAYVKSPGDVFVETSVLSGLTVDEVKDRPQFGRHAPRGDRAGRRAAESRRPEVGERDARRVGGHGVHARRLAVRAQARRLPAAREQVARRSAAAHAQWQRLHGGLSRDRARDQGAAVRRDHRRRRSRRARSAGQAELLAVAAARSLELADRHQSGGRRAARDVLRVRPARLRGLRPASAAARRA